MDTMTELAMELKRWMEIDVAQVFERFQTLAGAGSIPRGKDHTRFLYIPGHRPDHVLLLAHADTSWDAMPSYPAQIQYEDGVYSSKTANQGIGADDRAGCAMIWEMRDLGHSLLITSGEEHHQIASHWIAEHNPDVLAELNAHQFMVQFDRRNAMDFKCYSVGTDNFREYIKEKTKFTEPDRKDRTDIIVLARQICGVNLSVGYHDGDRVEETLVFAEWEQNLRLFREWLGPAGLPRFAR
jgi:hypothetical protein